MAHDSTRASLELLYHVSRELTNALDLRTVLQRILSLSLNYVEGERGSIVVLDEQGQPVDAAIIYGTRVLAHTAQQLRDTVDKGLAGWVVRHREPVLVADTSQDPRWLRREDDSQQRSGAKSAICVPVQARDKLVGVLTVVHPQPGFFNEEHLALIQAIADQAGVAVLNASLYAESQRQARVMTALAESAVAMNASLRLEDVLQRILDQTAQALRVETVLLALIDEARGELEFRAATGSQGPGIMGLRLPLGEGVAGRVAQDGRGIIVPDVDQSLAVQIPGLEMRAMVCAPVKAQARIIGVLEAVNPTSGSLDPDALLVLSGIGSLAGIAIRNAQLFEQLQTAHQRYQELFEDSIDPIVITDWDGHILEANRQALVTTGFDRPALAALTIAQLHGLNIDKTGAQFSRMAGGDTISYESTLRTQSGKVIPVQVNVRKIMMNDCNCLQWIFRDITERKDLDVLREDLSAMIYHDLRSPLANIISSLDVAGTLLTGEENPALNSVLNIASRSTDRVQRLLDSLLDINRLEAGQTIASQKAVDLHVLTDEALQAVRLGLESRQQQLALALPESLPLVWVDEDMIRRVIINLLENAVKFTPTQGRLEIGAQPEGSQVRIWVQDSGPGIPEGSREKIFEKYARLQQANAPKGLGLGLAFCRLVVQAHGGKIWVENRPGAGSRFIFTLPVAQQPETGDSQS